MRRVQLFRFVLSLVFIAMLVAMIFSVLKRTHVAEQAGVVAYIFLVIGVAVAFVDEMRTKPSDQHNGASRDSKKTRLRKQSV